MISSYVIEEFLDSYIPYQILKRGKAIYEQGQVEIVEIDDSSSYVLAHVRSQSNPRATYKVELFELNDLDELNTMCSCPYEGEICKHAVATLLEVLPEIEELEEWEWQEESVTSQENSQLPLFSPNKKGSTPNVTKSVSVEDTLSVNQVAALTDFGHSHASWWHVGGRNLRI